MLDQRFYNFFHKHLVATMRRFLPKEKEKEKAFILQKTIVEFTTLVYTDIAQQLLDELPFRYVPISIDPRG